MSKLPKSFEEVDEIYAIYHVQGEVPAGFSQLADEDMRKVFDDPNIPNYQKVLGDYIDTGGQTAVVFEMLFHIAGLGTPSIMFAMSKDVNSTEPKVEKHTEDAYVVYLPHTIFKEAGIDPSLFEKDGMVSKETLMAHREVFDVIGRESIQFLRDNISNFDSKKIALDGHYIDGGQSALRAYNQLRKDPKYDGENVSIWTAHTLGLTKLHSLLKKHLGELEDTLSYIGSDELTNHPLFNRERNIIKRIDEGALPEEIAKLIGEHSKNYDTELEEVGNLYLSALRTAPTPDIKGRYESFKESHGKETPIPSLDKFLELVKDDFLKNTVLLSGLKGLNEKYSFKDRLELESSNQVQQFDGVHAVSQEVTDKVNRWNEGKVPVEFILNGIDTTLFNPDAIKCDEDFLAQQAKKLLDTAWNYGDKPKTVNVEDLKDTKTFISVSRLDERKGNPLTIDAFVKFLNDNPNEKAMLVISAGELREGKEITDKFYTLENKILDLADQYPELKLKEKIKILPLNNPEARILYGLPNAVGLSPSYNEPWGMVGVEQMASGIPVIGSDMYASVAHFSKLCEENQSILTFQSPSNPGVDNKTSTLQYAALMTDVSKNYDKYKDRAYNNGHIIKDLSDWKTKASKAIDYRNNLIARQKVLSSNEVPEGTLVFQDIDGCITPSIDLENRKQHPSLDALKLQLEQLKNAKGISVLSTGRPLHMVKSDPLLEGYPADYAVTSSGVEIAKKVEGEWVPYEEYVDYLLNPAEGKTAFSRSDVDSLIIGGNGAENSITFTAQPAEKVAGERLGYYVEDDASLSNERMKEKISKRVHELIGNEIDFQVVPSKDPHLKAKSGNALWNVDIMPSKASKLGAAQWLIDNLKDKHPELKNAIVWGDSGNDKPAMTPEMYKARELEPAFITPANANPALVAHVHKYGDRGIVTATFPEDDIYSEHGGAGGLFEGLGQVLPQLLEKQIGKPPTDVPEVNGDQIGGPEQERKIG